MVTPHSEWAWAGSLTTKHQDVINLESGMGAGRALGAKEPATETTSERATANKSQQRLHGLSLSLSLSLCIYIYIYRERERERNIYIH